MCHCCHGYDPAPISHFIISVDAGGGDEGDVTLQSRCSTLLNYERNNAASVPGVFEWVPDLLLVSVVWINMLSNEMQTNCAVDFSQSQSRVVACLPQNFLHLLFF